MDVMLYWRFLEMVAVAFIVGSWIYWKFISGLNYWKAKGVTYLKPVPFFGNIKGNILMKVPESIMYEQLYWKLNRAPYGGIFHFTTPTLLIRDPKLIKDILVKDFNSFHDRVCTTDQKNNPLRCNFFFLSGKVWKNLRFKLSPVFASGKLKSFFCTFTEYTHKMLENLKTPASVGEAVEITDVIARLITDIMGSFAYGLKIDSIDNPNSEYRKYVSDMRTPGVILCIRNTLLGNFPLLIHVLKLIQLNKIVKFLSEAVNDMVRFRERKNIINDDFLQMLIQIRNKSKMGSRLYSIGNTAADKNYMDKSELNEDIDNTDFTDSLFLAQVWVMFLAGYDIALGAGYALYELALNQDIQDRLRKEVDVIVMEGDGNITYETLQKMKYLEQVIDETLRKYPLAGRMMRICTQPYKIPGTDVIIDKGTRVVISVQGLHHDPQYYPDPEKFDPDRFTVENKSSRPASVYLPFGEGPRSCFAKRFAYLQLKLILASLVTKYKMTLSPKMPVPLVFHPRSGAVLIAKDGIWLNISDIKK